MLKIAVIAGNLNDSRCALSSLDLFVYSSVYLIRLYERNSHYWHKCNLTLLEWLSSSFVLSHIHLALCQSRTAISWYSGHCPFKSTEYRSRTLFWDCPAVRGIWFNPSILWTQSHYCHCYLLHISSCSSKKSIEILMIILLIFRGTSKTCKFGIYKYFLTFVNYWMSSSHLP